MCESDPPPRPPEPPLPHNDTPPGRRFAFDTVDPTSYVGLTQEQAEARAEANSHRLRVGRVDDQHYPMTRDLRPNRITVEIEHGVVVHAVAG